MGDDIILHYYKKGEPTRVLRPFEFRKLINSIEKNEYKDKLEALLYSGSRYSEMRWLYENKNRLLDQSINMKNMKAKSKHAYRYIRLNNPGMRSVENYLKCKKSLPTYQTWDGNLKRWMVKAKLDPTGICCKSTRKSWESWLVVKYPHRIEEIFTSQGHEQTTALKHYLTFPFTDDDRRDMDYYVEGW